MKEARLYRPSGRGYVDCYLCEFHCHIAEGKRGVCGVRQNSGGKLYTLVWGKLIAESIDPIEKKPLFHFQPGSRSYSIATAGCNFRCLHCQNSEISQMPRKEGKVLGSEADPEEVAAEAYETGCSSISYTYTEPTIFFEYAYDIGVLARQRGLKNVFVTNGYMTTECIDAMKGVLDAANVDVKAFTEGFYKKVCGARLAPVLKSIERMRENGVWVEITTLVIPTLNDSDDELREIARWIYRTDRSMPWHISAFYPAFKMLDVPPTPSSTIERAREIGLSEGLRYVYTGNIPGLKGESTYCWSCGALIIERVGFTVRRNLVERGKCPGCKAKIDGVEL
ncbi:MAG: AmmeMemoRadiSam system radical SAM enzyme [Thermodesulfobacteriota bacterium]